VGKTQDLATVREAGFNVVVGPARRAYLDAAQAQGLKVLASPGTSAGPKFDPAVLRKTLRQFDQHPALWAWYLLDEPEVWGVSPDEVRRAHRATKAAGAKRPTAVVMGNAATADSFASIPDWFMIDRYPVPAAPVAELGKHVHLSRFARGPERPLAAVLQAFSWEGYTGARGVRIPMRPPTEEEMRCMTYLALARGANGLFYYVFDDGRWDIRKHPDTWAGLQRIIREVRASLPLFQAEHVWWDRRQRFSEPDLGFNGALDPAVTMTQLRVRRGDAAFPAGDYILAVNSTDQPRRCRFTPPPEAGPLLAVRGESRELRFNGAWVEDQFAPFEIRIYGPFPSYQPPG
jgi:hypothetical protein